MKKRKLSVFIIVTILIAMICSSCYSVRMRAYYADKGNYITATGVISHISYTKGEKAIYFSFSDLDIQVDDDTFSIEYGNFEIAEKNGIVETAKIGNKVSFITAPQYFGDGYIMPIVSITIDGVCFLSFEEGFENLQEQYKRTVFARG